VIHPGAPYDPKRWPLESFVRVARWLRERRGIIPVIVLGNADRDLAAAVRQQFAPSDVVLDSLGLPELIALISGAGFFLGNDSGPAHLAAAAGRPVVVVFGASDSAAWRPWRAAYRVVQNESLCNPCRATPCPGIDGLHCILTVTPEQVCEACDDVLAQERASVAEA